MVQSLRSTIWNAKSGLFIILLKLRRSIGYKDYIANSLCLTANTYFVFGKESFEIGETNRLEYVDVIYIRFRG